MVAASRLFEHAMALHDDRLRHVRDRTAIAGQRFAQFTLHDIAKRLSSKADEL
jgi:hypothetical protein